MITLIIVGVARTMWMLDSLMVCVLASRLSALSSSPGWGHCAGSVLRLDTLHLQLLYPSPPRCINGYCWIIASSNTVMDQHPIQGEKEYSYIVFLSYYSETRDKRRPEGPLGSYADFTLLTTTTATTTTTTIFICTHTCLKKKVTKLKKN